MRDVNSALTLLRTTEPPHFSSDTQAHFGFWTFAYALFPLPRIFWQWIFLAAYPLSSPLYWKVTFSVRSSLDNLLICYSNVFFLFIVTALGPCCCVRAFSSCSEQGLLFIVVFGLLIVECLSCIAGALNCRLGSWSAWTWLLHGTWDLPRLNPCPLHWQADS